MRLQIGPLISRKLRLFLVMQSLLLLSMNAFTSVARSMPPTKPADPIGVQTPGVQDTGVQATVLLETECGRATADAEYFIPESFSEHIVPSGTGQYGYRTKCPLWVVDFSMNSKSHSQLVNGVRVRYDTRFYGLPYDLPSSVSAGGTSPTVKEDCDRLRVEYIIYAKFKHEANFVLVKHITARGLWGSPGQCTLTKPILDENSFITKAPEANVRVIRVASRVKERTSWQEAAARADNPASQ